jgi:hypothetical protein
MTLMGLFDRVVTDTCGPTAVIIQRSIDMASPAYAGQTLTVTGDINELIGDVSLAEYPGLTTLAASTCGSKTISAHVLADWPPLVSGEIAACRDKHGQRPGAETARCERASRLRQAANQHEPVVLSRRQGPRTNLLAFTTSESQSPR